MFPTDFILYSFIIQFVLVMPGLPIIFNPNTQGWDENIQCHAICETIHASLVKLNNDIYQNEKGLSERDRYYAPYKGRQARL